jgi:hypothetical protein
MLERKTGVLLNELGYDLVEGKGGSCHVPFEITCKEEEKTNKRIIIVDYIINDVAIEVHSFKSRRLGEDNEYIPERKNLLENLGFEKTLFIRRNTENYEILRTFRPELTLDYHKIMRIVKKRIEEYDKKQKKLDEKYAEETCPF